MAEFTVTHRTDAAENLKSFAEGGVTDRRTSAFASAGPVCKKILQFVNDTGSTIAADSIIEMGRIGNCLILQTSRVFHTGLGTSRTLDIGYQEYIDNAGTTVAGVIDALADGVDAAALGTTLLLDDTTDIPHEGLHIKGETEVLVKVLGGTMPDDAEVTLHLEYIPYFG